MASIAGTAVVSGAGPVASLAAILLATQGWNVKVFERRAKPEARPIGGDTKAYLMAINKKGIDALKLAKVDLAPLIPAHNGRIETTMVRENGHVYMSINHPVDYKFDDHIRVFRDELGRHLIDNALRQHPDAITFRFEAPVESVDFERQLVTVAGHGQVHYDLLVGADGANSVVRKALQARMPEDFVVQKLEHDVVYKTGPIAPSADADLPNHAVVQLHNWKEGAVMVYGRGNGDCRVGLFVYKGDAERLRAGDKLRLLEMLYAKGSMPKLAPSAREAVKALIMDPNLGKFHHVPGWTYLSQLHGPKTVLLGDAAHTMTPVLGQGCNSGLEDATVFARMLQQCDGDIDRLLPAYTAARLPEITALLNINEVAAQERHTLKRGQAGVMHQTWVWSHGLLMQLHMALHDPLHKLMPGVFGRPAFMKAIIGFGSFRAAKTAMYWDFAALAGIAATAAALFLVISH